jgi:hypothetical protein
MGSDASLGVLGYDTPELDDPMLPADCSCFSGGGCGCGGPCIDWPGMKPGKPEAPSDVLVTPVIRSLKTSDSDGKCCDPGSALLRLSPHVGRRLGGLACCMAGDRSSRSKWVLVGECIGSSIDI